MSVPSTGMTAMWRNSIEDIKRLLETRHPNTYMIFNLSESKYDYDIFDNQVCAPVFADTPTPLQQKPSTDKTNTSCCCRPPSIGHRSWTSHFRTTTRRR